VEDEEIKLFPTDQRSAFGSALAPGSSAVLAIGLGYAKCGTTFMNMMLKEHENFYQSQKENHYLTGDEASRCKRDGPPNSTSDYIKDCFAGRWPKKGEATLDFTPRYGILSNMESLMKSVKVLQQTTNDNVNLRFLVSLRDPSDRAVSAVNMRRRLNMEGWLTMTDADLDDQLINNVTSRAHTDGKYYGALATWLRSFSKDSLLVVHATHLSEYETWKRIYSHLGLAIPSESRHEELLRKVNAEYWERQAESFMASGVSRYNATFRATKALKRYYRAPNRRLWKLLGTDPWW